MKPKKVQIQGVEIEMEDRCCAMHGCTRKFSVTKGSTQTICSIECWEVTTGKGWMSGQRSTMPPIHLFNEKSKEKYRKEASKRRKKRMESGAA